MLSYTKTLLLSAVLILALGVPALAAPNKDTLTVVIRDDIGTFDPHDNIGFAHHQATRQTFETLVIRNENMELIPWLAESWNYEDEETLIFKIRKGVKFHNGEELKASDVLFSLKRMRDDNTTAAMQVSQVDFDRSAVIDDYTVKVVTDGPFAMQLAMFENPLSGIINEKSYKESGGNFSKAPIGTGPYKLVSQHAGDRIVFKANENYWRPGEPHIPNLIIRIITESSSRAIEAESGGADIVYDIVASDVDRLRAMPNLTLQSKAGANTSYICFNVAQKPLDDIRVREAVWYAADIPSAIKIAYGNFGILGDGILSPGIEGRHPDLKPLMVKRDVKKAKDLLAEAGYPNGLELRICTENSNQQRMDFCEVLQAQLAEAGITLKLEFMEVNSWLQYMYNGKAQMSVFGFTASTGEAGRVLSRVLEGYTSEWQLFSYTDPEFRQLVVDGLKTIDQEKRYELFYKAQEKMIKDRIALPIWSKEINAAVQNYVKGFALMPSFEQHYLQFVYFE